MERRGHQRASKRLFERHGFTLLTVMLLNHQTYSPLRSKAILQQETSEAVNSEKSPSECPSAYFASKEAKITAKKTPTKKRHYLSTLVSVKAITEDSMVDTTREHENAKASKEHLVPKRDTMPGLSGISKSCSRPVAVDSDSSTDEKS
jgi:phosphopantetheinyl transferase (holo-ACP synthase)